ncbi:uncharacterized protein LOC141812929 [Curcuma longa]|uniref:uncharacterized protein LOC141812929 n=1 Tax=Curcuma longa TaxID=136217 RepID=UPI003D9F8556
MKKVSVSEQDVYNVSQRYSPSTILTLLKEISQDPGAKKDWHKLVKNTATGITNAREYQMLWRHLAYHHTLLDNIEEGAEPLDDESDLEVELEIEPPVSEEALIQARECVQVLSLMNAGVDQPPADGSIALASQSGEKVERSELKPGLDEAAEGVVRGLEHRLVGRKRRLDRADGNPGN